MKKFVSSKVVKSVGNNLRALVFASALGVGASVFADAVAEIQENVRDEWEDISEECIEVRELEAELPNLPKSTWWGTDQSDQLRKIRECQERIRKELLSVNTRTLLKKIEKYKVDIEKTQNLLTDLKMKRGFTASDKRDKLEAKIADAESNLQQLTALRDAELNKVKEELTAIGLSAKGGNIGVLMAMADRADIIDNAIVARGISEMLEGLRGALKSGDAFSAKRYYGVYLALVDVHILCYDEYIGKSRNGEWRQGLDRIEQKAKSSISSAQKSINSGEFTAEQCGIFRKTIETNNKLLAGVAGYRKLLDAHARAVERKLTEVRRQRRVVESLYETAANTADFGTLLQASMNDFNTVRELELPDLEVVDEMITQDQLDAISRMLDLN